MDVSIYGPDSAHFYVISNEGICIDDNGIVNDNLRQEIGDACEHSLDKQAETVESVQKDIAIGSTIENWENYEIISRT